MSINGEQAMENVSIATPMRLRQGFTGNRYSPDQKKRVLSFVRDFDSKHGRGGMAEAQRQFKVSYIALKSWLMKLGPRRKGGFQPVLNRLASIRDQMRALEDE